LKSSKSYSEQPGHIKEHNKQHHPRHSEHNTHRYGKKSEDVAGGRKVNYERPAQQHTRNAAGDSRQDE